LKQKEFIRVIADTNECLLIEPRNTKALNRKGLAFLGKEMITEAFETFEKVLQIEPENEIAQQELIKLRPKLPTRTPTRMKITEIEDEPKAIKVKNSSEKLEIPESSHIPSLVQNIVPEETTPFDKFMPKGDEMQPREKLFIPGDAPQQKKSINRILIEEIN
jgi:hypothetical protein